MAVSYERGTPAMAGGAPIHGLGKVEGGFDPALGLRRCHSALERARI